MAVRTGWVGSSSKEETGKAWMSPARLDLRLPKAGWMSEMVGRSVEIVMRTVRDTANMNIYAYFGSPTQAAPYVLYIDHLMYSNSSGSPAMTTGVFPAGSTLKIINLGHIRGAGGNGGRGEHDWATVGSAGGTALATNFPLIIDNTSGTIWGGGGGGGAASYASSLDYQPDSGVGGGGGAGILAGLGGYGPYNEDKGRDGSATSGGAGGIGRKNSSARGGAGGGVGAGGGTGAGDSRRMAGGRGGYSVQRNGHALTWIAVGDRRGSVV